jgi:hypothetical protein
VFFRLCLQDSKDKVLLDQLPDLSDFVLLGQFGKVLDIEGLKFSPGVLFDLVSLSAISHLFGINIGARQE